MASSATAHASRHHNGQRHVARGRSANGQVVGVLLMVFGLGWFLRVAGVIDLAWDSLLSAVLIVLGVGMAITARARSGGLLMAIGIFLTISLATTSSVGELGDLGHLIGDRRIRPQSIAALESEYDFIGGSLTLDLTEIEFPQGETAVEVDMGGGQIEVIVPKGVAVRVDAKLGGGEIELFDGRRAEGPRPRGTHTDEGYTDAPRQLRLDLSGGGGRIVVRRAPEPDSDTDPTRWNGRDDATG